jgi:hypothetical protein
LETKTVSTDVSFLPLNLAATLSCFVCKFTFELLFLAQVTFPPGQIGCNIDLLPNYFDDFVTLLSELPIVSCSPN